MVKKKPPRSQKEEEKKNLESRRTRSKNNTKECQHILGLMQLKHEQDQTNMMPIKWKMPTKCCKRPRKSNTHQHQTPTPNPHSQQQKKTNCRRDGRGNPKEGAKKRKLHPPPANQYSLRSNKKEINISDFEASKTPLIKD